MREIRERFNHRKNHQTDAEDRFAASLADDLRSLPEKEKFMAKLEIRNVIYKFQMKKFNSPKSNETSSNYNTIIPLPLKVHFEWTITVTFRAPFDPLEIVITFQYQQITLLVTKRRMRTISTNICKEIFYRIIRF